jgi:hypothetical protein
MAIKASLEGTKSALLPRALALEMIRPVAAGAALGTFVNNSGQLNHNGSNRGFRCHYRFDPSDGRGVVVMTNGENGDPVCQSLADRLI